MSNEMSSLNEECGIFGIWNSEKANQLTYFGLHNLQHRGQEGAGIVTGDGKNMYAHHGLGLLIDVFKNSQILEGLSGSNGIGHVRYATSGNGDIANIQPFLFSFGDGNYALAHNGNLTNALTLRSQMEDEGTVFKSNSDSEILMHLIRKSKKNSLLEKIKESANVIKGGFAYILLTDNSMIALRDANGFRPLSIGQREDGSYVVASETCALDSVKAEFIRDVKPGEVVTIDDNGMKSDFFTDKTSLEPAAMEFIYFARPDSNIENINIHSARKRTGKRLAKESPVKADIVIGIPNSSLSAASGFAEQSKLPYEMGLVKNQYVGRTFIQPTQKLREEGVYQKLSVVKSVVENKRVVLVDDSIVRGTTSRQIVKKLKENGATEVHLRIASPPLKYPDFYGIDIKSQDELIAANLSMSEMREELGCDSLEFLSIEGLKESIGINLCTSNFDGKYPAPICDYKEEYLKGLRTRDGK
ncbi:amidophosphoribosyltransferase [Companilactobacillus sp. RD055328]|uniref:amidophosphoribosyltransferase n=1 Tax=Companilactobacillus sp. RD055328 TaxID=2916634 RepID=UPI001FC7E125|nr:amidophosphoribosyltransferase [Companilactobacillus sp. RD055328]GKQ42594.1 amidophosphoribosyltransferase [Companilactobacillus sp. RD055328]